MGEKMRIFLSRATAFWDKWEIQALISTSLLLQIFLTTMGKRRKYSTSSKLSSGLWVAYQLADWLLIVSLSVLHKNVLWTPFFILHLGGPDTITAYAFEDNELWRRYNATFIGYLIVAIYFFYLPVSKNIVPYFVVFPMFIAGVIKTVERTMAMRSASSQNFNASTLRELEAGPNYPRYMEHYRSRISEGFDDNYESFTETPIVDDLPVPENETIPNARTLQAAYKFFKNFKLLFADLDLSKADKLKCKTFFQRENCEDAFEVIEIELGFMYDLFYTKAFQIYSRWGVLLRVISFSFTLSVPMAFLIIKNHAYSEADIIITYVLVGGAIMLEIYAMLVLLKSDWTMLWLSKHKNTVIDLLWKVISSLQCFGNKRWSKTMAQFDLITYCRKERPAMCGVIQKFICIYNLFEKIRYQDSAEVSMHLKELIFEQLREKSRSATDTKACRKLCACRGDRVLENEDGLDETIKVSVAVEFEQSILLWHIATKLIYNSDQNATQSSGNWRNNREASKLVSDYMLYLLVVCPFMLPNGIEQIRFQDTCAEATEFFEQRTSISNVNEACTKLLEVATEISPSDVKGGPSMSVLFDGCTLAKSLQGLDTEKRWRLISQVWVEMLCYAASNCRWNHHVKQLTRGGELLTHVWLLMAHLGIAYQF